MPFYQYPVIVLDTVDSTNLFAQQLVSNHRVEHGTVIVAHYQTAGRGQRGNKWLSSPGLNLSFSMVLFPSSLPVSEHFMLNRVFSLGVYDYLLEQGIKNVKVKWPNDIIVNDHKVAGILLENSIRGDTIQTIIAGIGINVNEESFAEGFSFPPVSMKQLMGKNFNINECLDSVLTHLSHRYEQLLKKNVNALKSEYLAALFMLDEPHLFRTGNGTWTGIVRNVADDGQLAIENENHEITFHKFNEISWVRVES